MKRKDFLAELSSMSDDELRAKSKELAEELMRLRFRKVSGQLDQVHRIREVKRHLARTKTAVTARVSNQPADQQRVG